MDIQLNTIAEAIEDIKAGKIIIVVDDEDRENEGDFVAAAETITEDQVNFMLSQGRGLLCAPLTTERCRKLGLELMVTNNTALHETPFTVSVDLLGHGCTTGISIHDRTQTIRALVDPTTDPSSLGRPGHIFPLRAVDKGVLVRPGHTEAVVDLTRLAGLTPGGVLIEILNADGTMARLPELMEIARKHNMKVVSIKDLVEYRLSHDNIVERGERVKMPTAYGTFEMIPYREKNGLEHFAIVKGNWNANDSVLIRVHSSCMTGDILGSCRCDCGDQLHQAMRMIEQEGVGAIVYLNQEGRGIGLMNKLHAYKLQEEGQDTVEANISLGFGADERDYGVGASIIRDLGITKMRLMSNNPSKRHGLEVYGLNIVENVSIIAPTNPFNLTYLKTKEDKMGHELMMKN